MTYIQIILQILANIMFFISGWHLCKAKMLTKTKNTITVGTITIPEGLSKEERDVYLQEKADEIKQLLSKSPEDTQQ